MSYHAPQPQRTSVEQDGRWTKHEVGAAVVDLELHMRGENSCGRRRGNPAAAAAGCGLGEGLNLAIGRKGEEKGGRRTCGSGGLKG